jgi:hypothetical protein
MPPHPLRVLIAGRLVIEAPEEIRRQGPGISKAGMPGGFLGVMQICALGNLPIVHVLPSS